jgi:hypothetical protein
MHTGELRTEGAQARRTESAPATGERVENLDVDGLATQQRDDAAPDQSAARRAIGREYLDMEVEAAGADGGSVKLLDELGRRDEHGWQTAWRHDLLEQRVHYIALHRAGRHAAESASSMSWLQTPARPL